MKVGDLVEMNYSEDVGFDLHQYNGTLCFVFKIGDLYGCYWVLSEHGVEMLHRDFLRLI